MVSAFAIGILASTFSTAAESHPEISSNLNSEANIDQADFLTKAQLETLLSEKSASEAEAAVAIDINERARLRALQLSLLGPALLALLAIVPALCMPGEIAGDPPEKLEPDKPDDIDETVSLNPSSKES